MKIETQDVKLCTVAKCYSVPTPKIVGAAVVKSSTHLKLSPTLCIQYRDATLNLQVKLYAQLDILRLRVNKTEMILCIQRFEENLECVQ